MVAAANMVEVAALVGDTARATILAALMGGQALTSSELAFLARVSRSTASEHLSKLVKARLIAVTKKRRFRYYSIASPLVARCLKASKRSPPSRFRLVFSRVPRAMTRSASRAPVTTIWPVSLASQLRMP
jgi:DNA-binding transcriptional ArsR family regulator